VVCNVTRIGGAAAELPLPGTLPAARVDAVVTCEDAGAEELQPAAADASMPSSKPRMWSLGKCSLHRHLPMIAALGGRRSMLAATSCAQLMSLDPIARLQ
jgi:hypothetical protein